MRINPKQFSGLRAVIIDLDGTMLDTAPDFQVAINRMRADLQLAPLAIEAIINAVGKGTENLIRSVLAIDFPPAGVEQHFDSALASYMAHYADINGDHATVYPGVIAGLELMREKKLRLACVTNKPYRFAVALLERSGLNGYFELVYGGDSLTTKKPDPGPMLKVCSDFQLTPAQVVAIGDSSNDALAARAAGCRVLTVPYGYNHGQPVQSIDSDGIVPTLLFAAEQIAD